MSSMATNDDFHAKRLHFQELDDKDQRKKQTHNITCEWTFNDSHQAEANFTVNYFP